MPFRRSVTLILIILALGGAWALREHAYGQALWLLAASFLIFGVWYHGDWWSDG